MISICDFAFKLLIILFILTDEFVFLKVKFAPKSLTQARSIEIRDIHNKWFEVAS